MIRSLISRVFLFSTLIFILGGFFIYFFLSKYNLQVDEFYGRITKYHDCGLILGTSRAAHALDPEYLDGVEYNFSFTGGHSPYDTSYFAALKNYCRIDLIKFDSNRAFILAVDPWVMSTFEGDSFELNNNSFIKDLGNNPTWNSINYIFKYIDLTPKSIFSILFNADFPKYFTMSEKGRLVLSMDKTDAQLKEKLRTQQTIEGYKNKKVFSVGFYSSKRFNVLKQMTEYLQKMGKVYYVRLPTSKIMYEIENERWPDFNQTLDDFGTKLNCRFINLGDLSDRVITIDGNHIWNGHSKWISQSLNDSLNAL